MTSLTKLNLKGIRNFDENVLDDRSTLVFEPPMTIIVGKNGCGKTTIIEALKYIMTGENPFGTLSQFINDPLLHKRTKTDAIIRIRMKTIQGDDIWSTRRLTSSFNKKTQKYTAKGDEHTIRRRKADGSSDTQISEKDANMKREMLEIACLSKAMLTNVIFCHQEDSNWPLSEGKKVKEIFDLLFCADGYTKAVENINKIRKEKEQEVKTEQLKLSHCEFVLTEKRTITTNLEENLISIERIDRKIADGKQKIEPIEAKILELSKRIDEITQIDKQLEADKAEARQLFKRIEELKRSTEGRSLFPTLEEAQNALKLLEEEAQPGLQMVDELNIQTEAYNQELKINAGKQTGLVTERATIEAALATIKLLRQKRDVIMREISESHSIQGLPSGNISNTILDSTALTFLDYSQSAYDNLFVQFAKETDDFNKKHQDLIEKQRSIREKVTTVATKLEIEHKQLENAKTTRRQTLEKISQMNDVIEYLKICQQSVISKEQELEQLKIELESQNFIKLLSDKEVDIDNALENKRNCQDAYDYAVEQQESTGKVDYIKKRQLQHQSELERLQVTHQNDIEALLKKSRAEGCSRNENIGDLDENRNIFAQKKEQLAHKLAQLPTGHLQEQLNEIRNKMSNCRSKIDDFDEGLQSLDDNVPDLATLQTLLEESKSKLDKLTREKHQSTGGDGVYQQLKQEANNTHVCPLCQTKLDQCKLNTTLASIDNKIRVIPMNMKHLDMNIEKQQTRYNSLKNLQPLMIDRCRCETELNELKEKSNVLMKAVNENKHTANLLKAQIEELELIILNFDRLRPISQHMQSLQLQIKSCTAELDDAKANVSSSQHQIHSISKLKKELREIALVIDTLEAEKGNLQSQQNCFNTRILRVNEEVSQAHKKYSDANQAAEQFKQLQSSAKQYSNEIQIHIQQTSELDAQLTNLQQELRDVEQMLIELEQRCKPHIARIENEKMQFQTRLTKLKETINEMQQVDRASTSELERVISELDELKGRQQQIEETTCSLKQKIAEITSATNSMHYRKRLLHDNINLVQNEQQYITIKQRIDAAHAQYIGRPLVDIQKELQSISKEKSSLELEIARLNGEKIQYERSVENDRKKQREKIYVHAEHNYKEAMISKVVVEKMIRDLKTYAGAIEAAVIEYHSDKMQEINAVLRELWNDVYSRSNGGSNDIEYIEIKAELPNEAQKLSNRKTYNYKVVMHIEGQDIEMRGRCSAGQKVLASILIRIALAEVFGSDFGMLALDEPTTNLDDEKIELLAEALVNLVNQRDAVQENFQLLVITHDERFAELLKHGTRKQILTYRVKRNEETQSSEIVPMHQ